MAGFLEKKQYAINPETRFVIKFSNDLCLECSIEQIFFSSSLMVSITERLRSNILSFISISTFFILLRICVIRCNPSTKRTSVIFWEIYPLSAYNFPLIFSINFLSFSGSLSSTFPGVITKLSISPLSFIMK